MLVLPNSKVTIFAIFAHRYLPQLGQPLDHIIKRSIKYIWNCGGEFYVQIYLNFYWQYPHHQDNDAIDIYKYRV